MTGSSTIAVIANKEGQDSQTLLAGAVAGWRKAGARVVGVLAENGDEEATCSAGFLRDIASGKSFSIQLASAPVDSTCHLDPAGVSQACAALLPQIDRADVVILSKFGKVEAMEQGLWAAFICTVAKGKPLLTTVSSKHAKAWTSFAPAATWLPPDSGSIERWWSAARMR